MNYKSYADLSIDILQEIQKVPSNIQLIVGIPRSGMVPAYMIGTQLNLPVTSLDAYLLGNNGAVGERLIKADTDLISDVLIVDDSVYSGTAINKAKLKLQEKSKTVNHVFCAIYSATVHNEFVDFYFKNLPTPRVFQWNYKNHYITTQSCYDIDGVLCEDPTNKENDDGDNYRDFLLHAKPLFIPSYKISCIVTSRLEKYRKQTEEWLKIHNVSYEELIMLDLPNASNRRALNIHGKFKAQVFKERSETYFIESSWRQAKIIYELTRKPVFCTENDILIRTFSDIYFFESTVNIKQRKQFENYYNSSHNSNFSHLSSFMYLVVPPIILKIIFKIFK